MSDVKSSGVSEDTDRPPRTIILCFDGTSGQYDDTNTNVVKLFGLLRKDCPEHQIAYYQAGIGTYFAPGVVSPLWTSLASLLDEAVAWYLDAHVMDGYTYLMDNYHPGDKICLFGFSRGAYTARALAGMLNKVGLLPRDNIQQVGFAYKAYTRTDNHGVKLAAGFKQTFARDVKIDFVGVWDTVQSTGVLVNRALPFSVDNTDIRIFRQALSLDECRARFRPNLYHWSTKEDKKTEGAADLDGSATKKSSVVKSTFGQLFKRKNAGVRYQPMNGGLPHGDVHADSVAPNRTQPKAHVADERSQPTDVLEVWFSGCHSDIGGGNVGDNVQVSLAQITLHWMVEQVIESKCGILFDNDQLASIGFDISSSKSPAKAGGSAVQELPSETNQLTASPEAYPEHSDAIAPLFDELKINILWWLLEIAPSSNAWQDSDGVWHSKWRINFGRGRFIPTRRPKFHHTVKERMEYRPLKYTPRAVYNRGDEIYV